MTEQEQKGRRIGILPQNRHEGAVFLLLVLLNKSNSRKLPCRELTGYCMADKQILVLVNMQRLFRK